MDRSLITTEALSWLGTPYVLGQHVKGAGCDCGTLPLEILVGSGVLGRAEVDAFYKEVGAYHHDWFLHTKSQPYLKALMRFCKHICDTRCYASSKTDPGNLVLRMCPATKIWNHAGIVIEWPYIVHAFGTVTKVNAARDPMWANRQIAFFDTVSS